MSAALHHLQHALGHGPRGDEDDLLPRGSRPPEGAAQHQRAEGVRVSRRQRHPSLLVRYKVENSNIIYISFPFS